MGTALVTGASRGVGRGIACALRDAGFTVYGTGRSIAANAPESVIPIPCDQLRDSETAPVFDRINSDGQELDVLINSAWGGYEKMVENGNFTWTVPFWQQPLHRWTSMIDVGVRGGFVMSAHAARTMVQRGKGLIVNISYWAAQKHIGNAIYGIAKAATDKMTADLAHELREFGVAVVSLYPGLVRTEAVMQAAAAGWLDVSNSESPEFIGRVIAALADDPRVLESTGRSLVAAALACKYGIRDIDGRQPIPLTKQTA